MFLLKCKKDNGNTNIAPFDRELARSLRKKQLRSSHFIVFKVEYGTMNTKNINNINNSNYHTTISFKVYGIVMHIG